MDSREDHVLIGKITGAHGLKGVLKIVSYAESPSLFEPGMRILVTARGKEAVECTVDWIRPHGSTIRMALVEVDDRSGAEGLRGADLHIHRDHLPELEEGTYYWFDLIGLSVFTKEGQALGQIESILDTGGNDVYVVAYQPEGQERRETLVPALKSVILAVELEENRMTVDLPEGL